VIINDKRALAYVVTIDEIKPIEGYDRVEYARTNGWWVIISKNDNLQVGDKCVYFEVDSKVNAEDERFAFLEKRNYKIKTQKMCKVISQGLLMPVSMFPEIGDADVNTDVTDILKVVYSVEEDNVRKNGDPDAKYKSMAARKPNIFKKPWAKWMMKRAWGRKVMFFFFGKKVIDIGTVLSGGGETHRRKHNAPPVFTLALTDDDPDSIIVACGKCDAFVLPGREVGSA
jgi:hypothetical protein